MFRENRISLDIGPVFIHASYLINIASEKADLKIKSVRMLRDEMLRAHAIGAEYVVLHTGTAHDGDGKKRASESIMEALSGLDISSDLIIENTSGKRGDISSRVEDMAELLHASGGLISGVCLDSCHAYAAGYDIGSEGGVERLADEVLRSLGAGSVKLLHVNDSKGELGSGLDRHEHLGKGRIGLDGLGYFVKHDVFGSAPAILETPKDKESDDVENLLTLRSLLGRS